METLGQKFRAAREKKKMTLSRAAALTHVKIQSLEMMENDDFSKMPAPTYSKGFIRIYSGLLGLDPEPLIQEYIDLHLNAKKEEKPSPRTKKTESHQRSDDHQKSNTTVNARLKDVGAKLQKIFAGIVPQLPRVGVAVVTALLLVGVVRCAVRMGSGSEDKKAKPSALDSRAIMKEPPVRYLPLPAAEGEQP